MRPQLLVPQPLLPFPAMAGSGARGKWEASTVTENTVEDLRSAGYLAGDIAHRVPHKGQVTPVAKARERVVFTSHFVKGL